METGASQCWKSSAGHYDITTTNFSYWPGAPSLYDIILSNSSDWLEAPSMCEDEKTHYALYRRRYRVRIRSFHTKM